VPGGRALQQPVHLAELTLAPDDHHGCRVCRPGTER
jgi:hypothetical protein